MIKCKSLTKQGTPCQTAPLKGEELCLYHSKSATALAHRKKCRDSVSHSNISRRELIRQLTKDFRALEGKDDDKSRSERLRIVPLLHALLNEQQDLGKLKKLAKEKGLI